MDLLIEQKALKIGNILNFFMAVCGIIVFILSNSKAVLLDGLFSFIQFLSTVIAIKISKDISTSKINQYPHGQYSKETLYVLFRTLLILLLLITSVFSATSTISLFIKDPSLVPQIQIESIMVNGIVMTILCLALSALYKYNNKKIGNCSDVLKAEAMGANLDGLISLGTALSFLLFKTIPFLKPLLPISDALLMLILSAFFAIQPIQILVNQINVLSYKRLHHKSEDKLAKIIKKEFEFVEIHDVFISRLGKFTEIFITLSLEGKFSISELDSLRMKIKELIKSQIKNNHIIIIFSDYI